MLSRLGTPLDQDLPADADVPAHGEDKGDQRRYSKQQYQAMWEAEQGQKLTSANKTTINLGCIGITANNLTGFASPDLREAYASFNDAYAAILYFMLFDPEAPPASDPPPHPLAPVVPHDERHAGRASADKRTIGRRSTRGTCCTRWHRSRCSVVTTPVALTVERMVPSRTGSAMTGRLGSGSVSRGAGPLHPASNRTGRLTPIARYLMRPEALV